MTTRTFLLIGGAIAFVYGVGFLLVPEMLAKLYGSSVSPQVILAYRYFGVALLGVGLASWAVKDLRDAAVLRNFLVALCLSNLAGVGVSVWGTTSGTINSLGWMNVALYAVLSIGCLYFIRILSISARAMPA